MQNTKDVVDVNKLYGKQCLLTKDEFIKEYNVNENGLNEEQVAENIRAYGKNEVKQAKPKKWYHFFNQSLFSPFNSILLGIVLILFYTDVFLPENPSFANIIVIVILVIVSTLLEFTEEYKSNKAAQKLKELVETTTTVLRNGQKVDIPLKEVTIGDIVYLSAGSMIPADLRVIESKDLYVGQSSLTGESDSVKKEVNTANTEEIDSILDLDNICFMGTNVISGSAKGVVIKVADSTYFGKIAKSVSPNKPKTSFQKGIENISKLLIRFMVLIIPIIFLFNAWKHDLVTAFTFAVAISITITPLLLPVILSSCLSKGAVRMSKKKTIVKKLDSIQNFGAMNILCTDKTGTLTEDRIVLEKYLDATGKTSDKILKYAYLNANFQTGLKGNIDEAVINRAYENGLQSLDSEYKKVDEIPFDFTRRRLSVVVSKEGEKNLLITKGAIEEILSICTMVEIDGKLINITDTIRKNVLSISKKLNKDGLRVVGVCEKKFDIINDIFSVEDEHEMIFLGFIGFLDPPKESAKESVAKLNKAGVRVIVLTGDNVDVTRCICGKVGINTQNIIEGSEIDKLPDMGVARLLRKNNIFAKLSPIQKARIVRILKDMGNVVGYMGDGINDSPSLSNSDVGVSVDTAVDIAKESADIILLEKDLKVLLDGVDEGRRTFANLLKYIKLATSFNFGEVLSVVVASIALPFLPETPIQLLVEGLLYDIGQMTLPFDNVDKESLKKPKKFDIRSLKDFMLFMGPISSAFDILVFIALWFVLGVREAATFQTIWFSYSIVSNLAGMHIIRTTKIPFIQSNAHRAVYVSSVLLSVIGLIIPFTFIGKMIGLVPIATEFIVLILTVTFLYCIVAQFAKRIYIKIFGEWI